MKAPGEYLDDAAITTKVKSELLTAKDVLASDISVETSRGDVHLSGVAQSEAEKQRRRDRWLRVRCQGCAQRHPGQIGSALAPGFLEGLAHRRQDVL